ncbi:MAG: hypothetical protein IE922_11835 [Sphingomonadales bacterium]|nr:hypothetical protein [Sphingomonadales bacterium]
MATRDISRTGFSRAKAYTDLHAQQGRIFTDADQVEQAEIRAEAARAAAAQTIGPFGSSDQGFSISQPQVSAGRVDFRINAGTLWLGGQLLTRPVAERFAAQSDWLNNPGASAPADGGARVDLAVIECWQQPVAAVEDAETFEPGLGGPDTSVRLRQMTRVRLIEGVEGATCEDAWAEARERLTGLGLGVVDAGHELVPDTRFTLAPIAGPGGDDLCSPGTGAGYLDAENQAIRIMITGRDSFIWGFDNAAPLYRAVLEDGGATLRLLTEPKDLLAWPAQGMTVEVLPWGAVLENGEKTAEEIAPGHFATVEAGYDPDTRRVRLTPATAVPGGFGTQWQSRPDADALRHSRYGLSEVGTYVFVRVWNRGTDTTPGPTLPLPAGPVPLGDTGLQLTVSGADRRPGDYVIAAARPATPDLVLPWQLLVGAPPMGWRRFVAPLALIRWQGGAGEVLSDCRRRFRPLTRLGGCCTYTVGDDNISFGDFTSIEAAVNALPPGGGQVCVLPGRYTENVILDHAENIRITGCGARTRIAPRDPDLPVFTLRGGRRIDIDDLTIAAPTAKAIVARGEPVDDGIDWLEGLRLRRLTLEARDRMAIDLRFVMGAEIAECCIALEPLSADLTTVAPAGQEPAIFAIAEDLLIADVTITGDIPRAMLRPAGGIQIGGGSERVEIRACRIEGGIGNGITLGHIVMISPDKAARAREDYTPIAEAEPSYPAADVTLDDNGCIGTTPPGATEDTPDEAPDRVPVSGGEVTGVVIRDCTIRGMGLSGIATPIAFNLRKRLRPVAIRVADLSVERCTIRGCAQVETPEMPVLQQMFSAWGGICLFSVEVGVFAENRIEANGRSHLDAICGLSVIRAEALVIRDNRILDNGPRSASQAVPRPGARGGIRIAEAAPQSLPRGLDYSEEIAEVTEVVRIGARALSVPAVTIQNNLVHQPLGKALMVLGQGAMAITGNHFASQGTTTGDVKSLIADIFAAGKESDLSTEAFLLIVLERVLGTAVTVVNTGLSSEMTEGLSLMQLFGAADGLSMSHRPVMGNRLESAPYARRGRGVAGGEVLLNDNIVIQNFLDGAPSFTLASVFALSLDDLSVQDNTLTSQVDFSTDFSVANLIGLGWSLRACGNRLEETLLRSLTSAVTMGLFNDTSHNQATHCLTILGHPALTVDAPNRVLLQAVNPLACGSCLRLPFAEVRLTDRKGEVLAHRLDQVEGHEGLVIPGDSLMWLPQPVNEVTVGFAGGAEPQNQVIVTAYSGETALGQQIGQLGSGVLEFTFSGSNITRLHVKTEAVKLLLLVKLCTGRPDFGAGLDLEPGMMAIAWNKG